jgi:hypothetical protein
MEIYASARALLLDSIPQSAFLHVLSMDMNTFALDTNTRTHATRTNARNTHARTLARTHAHTRARTHIHLLLCAIVQVLSSLSLSSFFFFFSLSIAPYLFPPSILIQSLNTPSLALPRAYLRRASAMSVLIGS